MKDPIPVKLKGYRDGESYKPAKVSLQPFKVTGIIEPKEGESVRKELEDILSRHSNYVLVWPMGGLPETEEYTLMRGIKKRNGRYPELELKGVLDARGKTYGNLAVDSVKLAEVAGAESWWMPIVNAVQERIIRKKG